MICSAGVVHLLCGRHAQSDLKHDFVRTYPVLARTSMDPSVSGRLFDEMRRRGQAAARLRGHPQEPRSTTYSARLCGTSSSTTRSIGGHDLQEIDAGDIDCDGRALPPGPQRPLRLFPRGPGHPGGAHQHAARLPSARPRSPNFPQQEYAGEDPRSAYKGSRKV